MKKLIALLLALLLALIIWCVMTHKDSIKPKLDSRLMITQNQNGYQLSGDLYNSNDLDLIAKSYKKSGAVEVRLYNYSSSDQMIKKIALVSSELKEVNHLKLDLKNRTVSIWGDVNSSQKLKSVNSVLNSHFKEIKNNIELKIPQQDISFTITKKDGSIYATGNLHRKDDANLFGKIDEKKSQIATANYFVDKSGVLGNLATIARDIQNHFNNFGADYKNSILTLSGECGDYDAYERFKAALKRFNLKVIDHTKLSDAAIKKHQEALKRAEEEAKKRALEKKKEEEELKKQAEIEEKKAQKAKKIEQEIKKVLSVENIEFTLAKSSLTAKGKETIKKLATILKKYPQAKVEIAGYTDNTGKSQKNLELSQKRVDSVQKELLKLGISQERLKAVGYGEANPIAPNDTEKNRKKNRRVEFHIKG